MHFLYNIIVEYAAPGIARSKGNIKALFAVAVGFRGKNIYFVKKSAVFLFLANRFDSQLLFAVVVKIGIAHFGGFGINGFAPVCIGKFIFTVL